MCNAQVAPPTAASIVANGVKANGKSPEPVEDKAAPVEDKDAPKVEAKEDGEEEVRCDTVLLFHAVSMLSGDDLFFWSCLQSPPKYARYARSAEGRQQAVSARSRSDHHLSKNDHEWRKV